MTWTCLLFTWSFWSWAALLTHTQSDFFSREFSLWNLTYSCASMCVTQRLCGGNKRMWSLKWRCEVTFTEVHFLSIFTEYYFFLDAYYSTTYCTTLEWQISHVLEVFLKSFVHLEPVTLTCGIKVLQKGFKNSWLAQPPQRPKSGCTRLWLLFKFIWKGPCTIIKLMFP